ncbi:uncharacterized protein LOC115448389 [Manduca sexta]|uniref:Uncharacterized protein n=1 Tax=Manduca sexta TaxID=7130 RepID=A0A921ZHN0_MANSE|nr:uncharacterized protein LOC115448389 [Manduca sexta]KAG6457748.1 hypothetical protein O3G_MSEX010471 [Manduca sexta]
MPFVKNNAYPKLPFAEDTIQNDFYIYYNLQDLMSDRELFSETTKRCRTIGILQSISGKFFLTDLDSPCAHSEHLLRVSMIYLKSPPQSTVVPYPVQVFGSLQWRNRPVIYAKLLQVLNPSMAIRLRDTLQAVTSKHLARTDEEYQEHT